MHGRITASVIRIYLVDQARLTVSVGASMVVLWNMGEVNSGDQVIDIRQFILVQND